MQHGNLGSDSWKLLCPKVQCFQPISFANKIFRITFIMDMEALMGFEARFGRLWIFQQLNSCHNRGLRAFEVKGLASFICTLH
jgi:hypothetical protein